MSVFRIFVGTFGLLNFLWAMLIVGAWVHGIVLAFSASMLLGVICFFIQVPYIVFGVSYWITGVDLAQRIVSALPQIFG